MNPRLRKIITVLFTTLVAGLVLSSGILKLIQYPPVVEMLHKMNVVNHLYLLGSMEIAFTLLFLYPTTIKLGFIFLCRYFAGALATEISHSSPIVAIGPLILIFISAFLRDPAIFLAGVPKK